VEIEGRAQGLWQKKSLQQIDGKLSGPGGGAGKTTSSGGGTAYGIRKEEIVLKKKKSEGERERQLSSGEQKRQLLSNPNVGGRGKMPRQKKGERRGGGGS